MTVMVPTGLINLNGCFLDMMFFKNLMNALSASFVVRAMGIREANMNGSPIVQSI